MLCCREFPVFPVSRSWTPGIAAVFDEDLEQGQGACISEDGALWAPAKDINVIDISKYQHAASARTHAILRTVRQGLPRR